MEDKEEAGERAREAVLAAMTSGDYHDNLKESSSGSSGGASAQASEESELDDMGDSKPEAFAACSKSKPTPELAKSYFGFDEDDDFMSDDEEGEEEEEEEEAEEKPVKYTTVNLTAPVDSKGKSKATA